MADCWFICGKKRNDNPSVKHCALASLWWLTSPGAALNKYYLWCRLMQCNGAFYLISRSCVFPGSVRKRVSIQNAQLEALRNTKLLWIVFEPLYQSMLIFFEMCTYKKIQYVLLITFNVSLWYLTPAFTEALISLLLADSHDGYTYFYIFTCCCRQEARLTVHALPKLAWQLSVQIITLISFSSQMDTAAMLPLTMDKKRFWR